MMLAFLLTIYNNTSDQHANSKAFFKPGEKNDCDNSDKLLFTVCRSTDDGEQTKNWSKPSSIHGAIAVGIYREWDKESGNHVVIRI